MAATEDDLAKLKDHIAAIEVMLLSHIMATDIVAEGTAKATIDIARSQRDTMTEAGRGRVAVHLNAMVDQLDQGLDF